MRIAAVAGAATAAAAALSAGVRAGLTAAPRLARGSTPAARGYDATLGRALAGLYQAVARDLRDRLASDDPEHIVDIGAGPGGLVVALAAQFPTATVTAVDIDPGMAALARHRIERTGLADRACVLVGDVGSLPLPTGSADLVTSSFSVHHWPDAPAGFAEVRRILRPGGRAIVYDIPDWWARLETKAPPLAPAAAAGGFPGVATTALPWPGPLRLVRRADLV
jgi:ubiquinone/menaquinone biosynthesis C-methylase UbiE